ncbi:MAG: tetratricopeptide repeat protein [Anaerolineae bacterium]|nr:tetratricopeptide repeat protein [Anaerolineae bacterium]
MRSGSSQFSAQDILNSSVCNIAGNYTEVEVKNLFYPAPATPQIKATHRTNLPLRRQFVGREDLLVVIESRLQRADGTDVTNLTGIAGVGKSALALEAAYRFSHLFPDGCYWIDLRSGDAAKALRDLLSVLGVANIEQLHDDALTLAEMARGQLVGKRVLLILDNAEGIVRRHRRQLFAMCLPAPAKTIITSRTMIDTDDIRVDVLNDDDALGLLAAKGIDIASQREDALKLVRRLGNLALAIEIIARRMCITKPAQSCADSLREIEESANLVDALKLPLGNMPDDCVAAAFALSYDLLDKQLRTTFHALGLCAPSGAPVQGIARMCNVTEAVARDSLRALAMLSLVDFDGTRAQLHPLLRDYARARAHANPSERNALIVRHAAYFGGEIGSYYQQALNDEVDSLPALAKIDREQANVQLAQERVLMPGFPIPELAVEITDYLTLYWRHRHTNTQQLLNWLTQACQLAERTNQQNSRANLLQAIGDIQAFCDQRDQALRSYERALELFTAIGDRLGQANTLKAIGDIQAFRKENDAALRSYERALELFTAIGDRLGQANTHKVIGDIYAFHKENDAALRSYERALELFTAIGDRLGQANTLKAIGDIQAFRDQHAQALDSYERALALFTAAADRLGQANTLQAIGDLQAACDQRDAALRSYERALELFAAIGDRLGQANTLKAIGDIQAFYKQREEALESYNQALTLFAAAESKLGQANTLKAIGDVQAFHDQHAQALDSYERALALFITIESKLGQANTLKAIGDIQTFHDQHGQALKKYEHALELFTAVGDRLGQANTLKAIGDVQALHEKYEAALHSYDRALELYNAAESKLGQAYTLQAIGDVHALCNHYDQALSCYEQALALFTLVGSTLGQANVYVSLGHLKGESSCFDKAIGLYASIHDAYSLARGKFYYALSLLDRDGQTAKELLLDARTVWEQINFQEGIEAVDHLLDHV